jgi:hypothetical protein
MKIVAGNGVPKVVCTVNLIRPRNREPVWSNKICFTPVAQIVTICVKVNHLAVTTVVYVNIVVGCKRYRNNIQPAVPCGELSPMGSGRKTKIVVSNNDW